MASKAAFFTVQGIIGGAVAWLLKIAYERKGKLAEMSICIKRIEEKLDHFIEKH